MVILGSVSGEKNGFQTGQRGRKMPSLVTLDTEFAIVPTLGTYYSHGGNIVKVAY